MVSTRSKTGAKPSPAPAIVKRRAAKAKPDAAPKVKTLPAVNILKDSGEHVQIHSYITPTTPGLIVFTYPKANTGGCTTQATGLTALKDDALSAGYNIVGASYDSVKSQAAWKVKKDIKLDLLSDTLDIGLLKKLGAHKAPKASKRCVFVFRKDPPASDAQAVLTRINITPKDCVALIKEYIVENPANATDQSKKGE